jgi:hypothetical protein
VDGEEMKLKTASGLVALIALLLCSLPVSAHHGYAGYDMQTSFSLKGTITYFMVVNPHGQIGMDVKDDKGNVEHWALEGGPSPRGMKDAGWELDSLKPGDEVTITYHPAKGSPHVGLFVKVLFPDGRVLPKPKPVTDPAN